MKNPKNILITGASSGIGEALALHYAAKNIFLALSGRNEERLNKVVEMCRDKGAVVTGTLVDVSDQSAMRKWVAETYKENQIDLVIANAGISGGTGGRFTGEPIAQARKIFDINVSGVFNTVEPAIEFMQESGSGGQIAIISSLAGFRGWPSAPAYSASKGAVRFYGEALRGALKDTGISVNIVCPGFVKSRMTDVNDFPMPFMMGAEKAAMIIAKGLARNKGRICFPGIMYGFVWLLSALPDFIAQKILSKAPAKASLNPD